MADISTYGDSFRHYVQPGADPDRALRPRNGARGMKCFSGYRRSASLAPPAEITPSNANGMPEGNSVIVRLRSNDDSRSSVRTTSGQPSPWLACPAVAQKHESVLMLLSEGWWRRGEFNVSCIVLINKDYESKHFSIYPQIYPQNNSSPHYLVR